MSTNIILSTDGYKLSHAAQYPPDVQSVYSYMESRGGRFSETVFFGLNYIMTRYLAGPVVTAEKIAEAEEFVRSGYLPPSAFNKAGWEYILEMYDGHLPLRIQAVAEGAVLETGNVLFSIESMDPQVPWLTNYVETLLMQGWAPCTVATYSRECKKVLSSYLEKTSDSQDALPFMLHDFGYRGVSSEETASILGAAHLTQFMGTDTIAGIRLLKEYYNTKDTLVGTSIPASEHSTITSWGREAEVAAYENMLNIYSDTMFACVVDSYDVYNACEHMFGGSLREKVLARAAPVVLRPDSGDPHVVIPRMLEILGRKIGATMNSKGFKVLHPNVRLIQGDGVALETIDTILRKITEAGWSSENVSFGSGGNLLQNHNRDTQRFAIKCSAVAKNMKWHDVYKDPVTDPGKASKRGRLKLIRDQNGKYRTVSFAHDRQQDHLRVVFANGMVVSSPSLKDIRSRSAI